MSILLNVGYGVRELKNFTSDSQDGWRWRGALDAALFELEFEVAPDTEVVGMKMMEKTFLINVSIRGSLAVKLSIDETDNSELVTWAGIADALCEAAELIEPGIVATDLNWVSFEPRRAMSGDSSIVDH